METKCDRTTCRHVRGAPPRGVFVLQSLFRRLLRIAAVGIAAIELALYGSLPAQEQSASSEISSQRALADIFADRHVPGAGIAVLRRSQALPLAERYAFLANWVVPGPQRPSFRLAVDFTPAQPAPPVSAEHRLDRLRVELAKQQSRTHVRSGGNLVSPAVALVEAARETGTLDVLQARVAAASPTDVLQREARLTLLVLIDLERADIDSVLRHLDSLYPLIEANTDHTLTGRAAELLVIHAATRHPRTRAFARDAAANIIGRFIRISGRGPAAPWETHFLWLAGLANHLGDRAAGQPTEQAIAEFTAGIPLEQWHPASHATAASRGDGATIPHWRRAGHAVENAGSHLEDFLYYHVPLRGNFQVECDVQTRNYLNTQLIVAGHWAESLYYGREHYDFGDLRRRLGRTTLVPKLSPYREWMHHRVVVENGTATYFANGRQLHTIALSAEADPWVILRSDNRHDGPLQDVRISGEPVIPEEICLTASPSLNGWWPYFEGSAGNAGDAWSQLGELDRGGGIVGRRRDDSPGMHIERLLQYHRPMLEDGNIDYEFFYEEGESAVHPALDRLAFLLDPAGVRIHWVTDGAHDRTSLAPDNVFDEPAHRRGAGPLPLKPADWNHLRLTLHGDVLTLALNGESIYERALEVTNQRQFGLFHFADQSAAQVRNVRWRGNWPRTLLPMPQQELADPVPFQLDAQAAELPAAFEHDFAAQGIPAEQFTTTLGSAGQVDHLAAGARVIQPGGRGYFASLLRWNAALLGDFDIVAEYEQFVGELSEDAIATAGIRISMSQDDPQQALVLRRFVRIPKQEDTHVVQAVLRNGETEAQLDWRTLANEALESTSGRLRIARRGRRLFYLSAAGDSPCFRLLQETEVLPDPLPPQAVRLLVQTSGVGRTDVVWKKLLVRAEDIIPTGPAKANAEQTAWIMNHDGTELRRLLPEQAMLTGLGSPTWSPDGKQVAFDVYNGSTARSRLYVMNADGSQLRDLGIGNMPSFSPDGKRIVFSWGGRGITTMSVDGSQRAVIDPGGWGAHWSADGRIAYVKQNNIAVFDPVSRTTRLLLQAEQAARYSSIYWNLAWSRDSQQICFKARRAKDAEFDVAVVQATGSNDGFQVLYSSPQEMIADFSWHPDHQRVLFCLPVASTARLSVLDCRQPGRPEVLAGQPLGHSMTGVDWSADGKKIVFTSRSP